MDAVFSNTDFFPYEQYFEAEPHLLSPHLKPIFDFLKTLYPRNTAQYLINGIKTDLLSYIKIGFALDHIMKHPWIYQKLGCKKFADFCSTHIGKSFWQCKQIIGAAKVCMRLIVNGDFASSDLPNCIAQAAPLIKFLPSSSEDTDNDEVVKKWGEVVEKAQGRTITASLVKEITNPEEPEKPKPQQVKIPADTYAKLEKIAKSKGITIREVIDELADLCIAEIEEPVSPVTPEKQAEWEADLEALIAEQVQVDWEISDSNGTSYHTSYINPRPGSGPDSS